MSTETQAPIETQPATPAQSSILTFGRWDITGTVVEDPGLQRYITLEPRLVPKTGARYAGKKFHKSKVYIVERLLNKIMVK